MYKCFKSFVANGNRVLPRIFMQRVVSNGGSANGEVQGEADVSDRHFGQFGGRYIPETLVEAHRELEEVGVLRESTTDILALPIT